jgi:DNA-binding response OmpR family regulator
MKVLVVEDDPRIGDIVARRLGREDIATILVGDGNDAIPAVRQHRPDLVLLDLSLPGRNGLEICRDLKRDPDLARTPVIIMSGWSEESDRIAGLEIGADDYVTKPFSDRELLLRVKAVIRRAHGATTPPVRRFGSLTIDHPQRRASVDGATLMLTAKEFDLLDALAEARGRVLTRQHLLKVVWGYAHGDVLHTRTIDVHVRHLRRKLGSEAERLETVKGVGYRLNPEGD